MRYSLESDKALFTINNMLTQCDIQRADEAVPMKAHNFLLKMGWETYSQDPTTNDSLYERNDDVDLSSRFLKWYEAVAYEWVRMMTLGGD